MQLKLFRATGCSSILAPGESRVALHPQWCVLAISVWVGTACNMHLWSSLRGGGHGLAGALLMGLGAAGASGFVLSMLGWRRTLKPAAVIVIGFAVWAACGWVETGLSMLVPLRTLMQWEAAALAAALMIPPYAWSMRTPVRRLAGAAQLASNIGGALISLCVVAVSVAAFRML